MVVKNNNHQKVIRTENITEKKNTDRKTDSIKLIFFLWFMHKSPSNNRKSEHHHNAFAAVKVNQINKFIKIYALR